MFLFYGNPTLPSKFEVFVSIISPVPRNLDPV